MRAADLFLLMLFAPLFLYAQKNVATKTWAITLAPSIIPLPGNQQIGIQTGLAYQFKPRLEALAGVTFNAGKISGRGDAPPRTCAQQQQRHQTHEKSLFH